MFTDQYYSQLQLQVLATIADFRSQNPKMFLFQSVTPTLPQIDLLYESYQHVLLHSLNQTTIQYNTFLSKLLTTKQRQDLQLEHETQDEVSERSSIHKFSQKIQSGEINIDLSNTNKVAKQMMIELNLLSGRIMLLHYKTLEIIRAAPRFYSEYL